MAHPIVKIQHESGKSEQSIPQEKREVVYKSYLSVRPEHLVRVRLSPNPFVYYR